MMTDDEIERVAAEVLEAYGLGDTFPVDPFLIAQEEQIELLPGVYDNCFDGRIEYRRADDVGRFYLFYAEEEPPFRPPGRVRFSVAHELGHFYLPPHREYLLSGVWHNSHSDADPRAARAREREANRFASELLMPRDAFIDAVRDQPGRFCTLKDLRRLANEVFQTSITSTALRYVQLNCEPCSLIVAEKGSVIWSACSDDLIRGGFGKLTRGQAVPPQSVTAKAVISSLSSSAPFIDGAVNSSVWLDGKRQAAMWEEVVLLTTFGRTITLLAPQDHNDDD
jgi:hypothetical protein